MNTLRHWQKGIEENGRAGAIGSEPRTVTSWRGLSRRWVCSLACCFALTSLAAAAEPPKAPANEPDFTAMSLEELGAIKVPTVVGASRFAQKTTEAPASVSIITQDDFKVYGYRTLAEALQSLQGFHVTDDRNYSFLGARGINLGDFNSRMLVMVDGHRINNNLTDGAALGTDFIVDVDLIEHVEVIRGPGSVLYGNNAFFGVINVVTRKGSQVNGVELSGEYASFDTFKGRVTVGKSFTNGVELLLSGTFYDSAGPDQLYYAEYDKPKNNNGVAQDMNSQTVGNFFGSLGYKGFTLEGGYISRDRGNPTAEQFTTFNDPQMRTVYDRSYADLKFVHEFPEAVDVTARLYYDRNNVTIDYPVGDPVATGLYQEVQQGEWWGAELQLSKRLWDKHIITAGVEYRDDFRQAQQVFDQSQTYKDLTGNRKSYGIYVQGDFQILTNLHFNGGLRYDKYGDYEPSINPRLALIYNPFPESTIKAIYGSAFRAPNFLELSDARFQDIKPEGIKSYELVYEQGIGRHMRSSVAGFYNRMDDLIIFESGSFSNVDAESRGAEFMLEGTWANGIRGRVSYTIQKTENSDSNVSFADSPEQMFKFNISMPVVHEKLIASLEYQYTSSRHTTATGNGGVTVSGVDTEAFGVVNLTLFSHDLLKNLDISASVYNLLNESYADPSTRYHLQDQLPRDGRTFRIKMTYRF